MNSYVIYTYTEIFTVKANSIHEAIMNFKKANPGKYVISAVPEDQPKPQKKQSRSKTK